MTNSRENPKEVLKQTPETKDGELAENELADVTGGSFKAGKPPFCGKCRKCSPLGSQTCVHCGAPFD